MCQVFVLLHVYLLFVDCLPMHVPVRSGIVGHVNRACCFWNDGGREDEGTGDGGKRAGPKHGVATFGNQKWLHKWHCYNAKKDPMCSLY